MLEFYPQIKWVHIAAVIAAASLFALRGAGVLAGARWPMCGAAALPQLHHRHGAADRGADAGDDPAPVSVRARLADGQGAAARRLRRARHAWRSSAPARSASQAWCYVAALLVFLFIVSIARAHHPLGIFARLADALSHAVPSTRRSLQAWHHLCGYCLSTVRLTWIKVARADMRQNCAAKPHAGSASMKKLDTRCRLRRRARSRPAASKPAPHRQGAAPPTPAARSRAISVRRRASR